MSIAVTFSFSVSAQPAETFEGTDGQPPCLTKDDLKRELKAANKAFRSVQDFVEYHGIEVAREPNMRQEGSIHGEISGQLRGDGAGFSIGRLGSLFSGFISVLENLTLPSARMALDGLAGFGGASASLSGELKGTIEGKFEGRGVEIHRDANLFIILTKNSSVGRVVSQFAQSVSDDRETEGADLKEGLDRLWANPYIATDVKFNHFLGTLRGLKDNLRCIGDIIVENIDDKEPAYAIANSLTADIQNWLRPKRLVVSEIAPERLRVQPVVSKVRALKWGVVPNIPDRTISITVSNSATNARELFYDTYYDPAPNGQSQRDSRLKNLYASASASLPAYLDDELDPWEYLSHQPNKLFAGTWNWTGAILAKEISWESICFVASSQRVTRLGFSYAGDAATVRSIEPLMADQNLRTFEMRLMQ